ncbi:10 kDa chaperonin [Bienertia sinuspersici]
MSMDFEKYHLLSLKQNLKLIYSSCCNFSHNNDEDDFQKFLQHSKNHRSCCKKLKSKFAKLFSAKHRRNRRSNSYEFKYDPLSYSLNFEDDDSHLDEYPLRNFCSRLPPSPVKQRNNNGFVSTQITAWS